MLHKPTRLTLSLSFITAVLVANMAGPQYVYPAFGTSLTTRFKWTALENSLVSTASFIGVSFSGPLNAWMVERLGIRGTLRVSALLAFFGPFLLAQTYNGVLPSHFWLCALYLVAVGVSGAAAYLCALDSQAHNFKAHRGMSMGVTSAGLGLCGVVFSQINDHLFAKTDDPDDNDTYGLLMFMAFSMSGAMILGSMILGPLVPHDVPPIKHSSDNQPSADESTPLIDRASMVQETEDDDDEPSKPFLSQPVGFALFVTLFMVLGMGYVYLANIGQILLALPPSATAGPQHLRNIHVSVFSTANCAARAAFGTLSDVLKSRWGIHRIWMFFASTAGLLCSLVYLVSAVSTPESLLPCTVMVAVVYGTVFGVAPAATTEFGTKVFARNWGWLLYAPAFGSQIFNVLFGYVYDQQAQRQGVHFCRGMICVRDTFLVGIVCTLLTLVVLSWAIVKKRLYQSIV